MITTTDQLKVTLARLTDLQSSTPAVQSRPIGRPLKFKDAKTLQKSIDKYFDDCDETGRPYTISGLAIALSTSRRQLIEYQERDEFHNTIKDAKLRCENYLEEGLLKGKIPPAAGIFNQKNNYGYRDKTEVENTNKNIDVVAAIREIQKENALQRGDEEQYD